MTIRPVCQSDAPSIQRMAARFLSDEGPYGTRFTAAPERIAALVDLMTSTASAVTFLAERDGQALGMLGMFTMTHPITGDLLASELCWWVEPEARTTRAGLALLRAGEAWARAQGAAFLEMIAPTERVGAFYERVGYERTDVHYLKRLIPLERTA